MIYLKKKKKKKGRKTKKKSRSCEGERVLSEGPERSHSKLAMKVGLRFFKLFV
jgi:hypothetical protein